jgi:hypothetical protein
MFDPKEKKKKRGAYEQCSHNQNDVKQCGAVQERMLEFIT